MGKKFKTDLSVKGINNLIKQLNDYQSDLQKKCEEYVRLLAEEGIDVAQQNVGNFGKYITFTVKTNQDQDGCKAVMLATNTGIIKSQWKTKEGVKSADVSPLLMVEFGSGLKAKNPKNIPGVGTGTFPGGTHGNEPGWWYMDLNDVWHYSTGMEPKQPMYKASLRIANETVRIAKVVFG